MTWNIAIVAGKTFWISIHDYQGVSQEGKIFFVLHELANKTQLGVWAHCELLNGFTRGPGAKALEKFTIFSLKLVWYSPLKKEK